MEKGHKSRLSLYVKKLEKEEQMKSTARRKKIKEQKPMKQKPEKQQKIK